MCLYLAFLSSQGVFERLKKNLRRVLGCAIQGPCLEINRSMHGEYQDCSNGRGQSCRLFQNDSSLWGIGVKQSFLK